MGSMDISSLLGILIGFVAIIAAFTFESGSLATILQPSAALVVVGGTLGAVMLNFPLKTVLAAFRNINKAFLDEAEDMAEVLGQVIELAYMARQEGLLSLQNVLPKIQHRFLKRGLMLALDITNPQLLHDILTTEINLEEEQSLITARVFEAIGGFSPTFGIIGAVLGLIQVMGNLQDPSKLGHGIASAFVSTIYGVGLANLVFLPIAGKLKMKVRDEIILKEMILQGLIAIHLGENPAIIEEKLLTFINYSGRYNHSSFGYRENGELT